VAAAVKPAGKGSEHGLPHSDISPFLSTFSHLSKALACLIFVNNILEILFTLNDISTEFDSDIELIIHIMAYRRNSGLIVTVSSEVSRTGE
jgi:hypothetical protein